MPARAMPFFLTRSNRCSPVPDANLSNPAVHPEIARLWEQIAEDSNSGSQNRTDEEPPNSETVIADEGATFSLPLKIGRYRILRLIGEGGMGLVYEAEQDQPQRTVALKVIRSGFSDPKLVRRFEHELLALGRLQHPGIAQIYEAGTAEGALGPQPYFAMEFIRGQLLLECAEFHQLSIRQRLELMARICEVLTVHL
jgi:serine/threonine protein kinase